MLVAWRDSVLAKLLVINLMTLSDILYIHWINHNYCVNTPTTK